MESDAPCIETDDATTADVADKPNAATNLAGAGARRRISWLTGLYNLHGPPGPPIPHTVALPTSWPTTPFVDLRTAPFPVELSRRELSILLRGFVPRREPTCPWQDTHLIDGPDAAAAWDVPEDKWFIYATEERDAARIHIHRSWTGVKLIELVIDMGSTPSSPPSEHPRRGSWATPSDDRDRDELYERRGDGAGRGKESGGGARGPRIVHIAFEMHGDYKLRWADERVYKVVAREISWWVMGVCLGPEMEA
ncbi:uncharacterized protein DNG_06490 [Cephalotrichum gorgonifer]|uniref:Uncharacterized protein n=1 Tax=Cephalotrichum gorgonifer TaxID=2041049 RepID=A0AAE8N2W1_9PEZI|nr:uncharacterized protein DNG_06490 [Cephalotrichum gorgonifer]